MNATRRAILVGLAILSVCGMAGCYDKSVQGDTSVYSFAWWIGVGVILGGLLFVPAGWLLRRAPAMARWNLAPGVRIFFTTSPCQIDRESI